MKRQSLLLLAFIMAALCPVPVRATDLTKINRAIAKEPVYKNKPKYCLLVLGQEAKHRVWLVQDGDVLYIDRNGNGDLTEPDEKITAEKNSDDGEHVFKLSELRAGDRVHRDLYVGISKLDFLADQDTRAKAIVAKNAQARAYLVMIAIEMPGWKGSGVGGRVQQRGFYMDVNGVLQFADRPQDAPILHFDGPLAVTLFGPHELKIGRQSEVALGVGSPGVGPGSHTYLDYEGVIPEKAYPTLEVVYPPPKTGEPPTRVKLELKQRC